MLLSTPGIVLHVTPYAETSVVAKIFTRQLGVCSYLIKGVRGRGGHVKQNLLAPLTVIDMVVYDSHRGMLNYIKELSLRHSVQPSDPIRNALRFFMTEVLYKTLREEDPVPELFDYVEGLEFEIWNSELPLVFLLNVARHLGIEPLDNFSSREIFFDLQEGRYVGAPSETTLSVALSMMLHHYLCASTDYHSSLSERRSLLDALIVYYQLHLSGFRHFHSHEILHTILN